MLEFKHKTADNEDLKFLPKVYFTCHRDDYEANFEKITDCILEFYNCDICYTETMDDSYGNDRDVLLGEMNLFVFPVTKKLLSQPSRAIDEDLMFAYEKKIPVLPIVVDVPTEIDNLYSKSNKFGMRHYLMLDEKRIDNFKNSLRKYLDIVLNKYNSVSEILKCFSSHLFLSYRKKDRKYAVELMKKIHSYEKFRTVSIWYDEFLLAGEDFTEKISAEIQKSCAFILLVTKNLFEEGNYVKVHEYPDAKKKNMKILPIVMDDTDYGELKEFFKDKEMPPFIRPSDTDFEKHIADIINLPGNSVESNVDMKEYFLGTAYLNGIQVETNRELGVEILHNDAENNDITMLMLYEMYMMGKGVDFDTEKAHYWAEKYQEYAEKNYKNIGLLHVKLNTLAMRATAIGDYAFAEQVYKKAEACEVTVFEDMRNREIMYMSATQNYLFLNKPSEAYESIVKAYDILYENPDITVRCIDDFYILADLLRRIKSTDEMELELLLKEYTISKSIDIDKAPEDVRDYKLNGDVMVLRSFNSKKMSICQEKNASRQEREEVFKLLMAERELHKLLPKIDHNYVYRNISDTVIHYSECRDFKKAIKEQENLCELMKKDLPYDDTELLKSLVLLCTLYGSLMEQLQYHDKNESKRAKKKMISLAKDFVEICESSSAALRSSDVKYAYDNFKILMRKL